MGVNPYRDVVYRRGEYCVPLTTYDHCTNNALLSASPAFTMFVLF